MADEKTVFQGSGATKNLKDKIDLYANGRGWPAERYAALGLYVLMYNRFKNNRDKILNDLTKPGGKYYVQNDEERKKIINFFGKAGYCTDDVRYFIGKYARNYFNKEYNLRMTENEFGFFESEQQLMVLESQATDYARQIGRSGMLTVGDMRAICDLKIEDSRRVFEGYRKSVTEKGETNIQKGSDGNLKESNGWAIDAFKKAEIELKQRNKTARRDARHGWVYGLLGAGAAALTVTSFFTLVPFIGISFGLTGIAGVVTGIAGTVLGGLLTKFGLGRAITKFSSWRKKRKDIIAWKKGEGKYMGSSKDAKSYAAIKYNKEYNTAIRNLFFNYKSLRAMERSFTDNYKKKNGIEPSDTSFDAEIRKLFIKEQEKIVKDCFKPAKLNETKFKDEYREQHPGATDDEINKAFEDAKILRGTFSESKAKEIEMKVLMNNEYVKPIIKYLHAYGEPVKNGGYDQAMALYEELKNNYESSADGVDFGKQSEAHFGRLAEVKSLLAHQPEEYISEERTPQTMQNNIEAAHEAFTHPTEKNKHNIPSPTEVAKMVSNLFALEQTYKNSHAEEDYLQSKIKLAEIVVETYKRSLFDDAFTSTTISDIQNILDAKDSQIKKLLEEMGYGDVLDDIENMIKFMTICGDTGNYPGGIKYKIAREGIGVSFINQLNIDKEHLIAGVKQLGIQDGTPEYASIQNAISQIVGMQYQTQNSDIKTTITSITYTDPNMKDAVNSSKNYLQNMLDNKTKLVNAAQESEIVALVGDAGIAKKIFKLYDSHDASKASEIRSEINKLVESGAMTKEQRDKAIELINKQVTALAIDKDLSAKQGAVNDIKSNSYIGYSKMAQQINELKDFDDKKFKEMYEKIKRSSEETIPVKMQDLLVQQLKSKVQNIIENDDKSKYDISADQPAVKVVGNLQKLLVNISHCVEYGCLDEWQREHLILYYQTKFDNAVDEYVKSLEKGILKDEKDRVSIVSNMLKLSGVGANGLAEYFSLNTPVGQKAVERLNRIKNFQDRALFSGKVKHGNELCYVQSDADKNLMFLYMSEDRSKSKLREVLVKLSAVAESCVSACSADQTECLSALPSGIKMERDSEGNLTGNLDTSTWTGDEPYKKFTQTDKFSSETVSIKKDGNFIVQVLNLLKDPKFKNDLPPHEKIIVLQVIKKNILSMVASQLLDCKTRYSSDESMAKRSIDNGGGVARIIESWKDIAAYVDSLISQNLSATSNPDSSLSADLRNKYIKISSKYLGGVSGNTAYSLMQLNDATGAVFSSATKINELV